MVRLFQIIVLCFCLLALLGSGPRAVANPVGDFFKKVGRSISKITKSSPPPKTKSKTSHRKDTAEPTATPSVAPTATPTPSSTPQPLEIRPAASAPSSTERRDVPYGVAVPNRPGLVTSPYAPNEGFVDVRGFPSSTEVLDPFTGKIFLTP